MKLTKKASKNILLTQLKLNKEPADVAKLYFRFGAMGSAKTLNLLAVAHNYRQQNKKVLLIKPKIDLRFGAQAITSRAGLSCNADLLLSEKNYFTLRGEAIGSRDTSGFDKKNAIPLDDKLDYSCFLVDESQFLSEALVEELYAITIRCKVPVIAYGLKTDFRNFLFCGSKRLLELADTLEEIKTTCFYCDKKATHNIRLLNDKPVFTGETVDLGSDEKYRPCCKTCLYELKQPSATERGHLSGTERGHLSGTERGHLSGTERGHLAEVSPH